MSDAAEKVKKEHEAMIQRASVLLWNFAHDEVRARKSSMNPDEWFALGLAIAALRERFVAPQLIKSWRKRAAQLKEELDEDLPPLTRDLVIAGTLEECAEALEKELRLEVVGDGLRAGR